jgi:hypothetical protein
MTPILLFFCLAILLIGGIRSLLQGHSEVRDLEKGYDRRELRKAMRKARERGRM